MNTGSTMQKDIDERAAEPVGAQTTAVANGYLPAIRHLIELCRSSKHDMAAASENVQNRGMKVLLKAYARERENFADQLAQALHTVNNMEPPEPFSAVQRGLVDIQAAMTLGREDREHVVLSALLESEQKVLQAYQDALAADLPPSIRNVVEEQYERIQVVSTRIGYLENQEGDTLVVRLFDDEHEAAQAMDRLQAEGFQPNQIDVAGIETLRVDEKHVPDHPVRRTVIAGGVSGGIVGAVVGIAVVLFQSFLGSLAAMITLGPVPMIVVPTLLGMAFGAIFGFVIGSASAEEDTYLYEQSLHEGATLVVVEADKERVESARRLVGLYHEHEVPSPTQGS